MKFALQLYSVRDACTSPEAFLEVLRKVKEMGYDGVEFAGTQNIPASELKKALDEIGLVPVACHEGGGRFERGVPEMMDYYNQLGCHTVVCAGAPTDTMEDLEHLAENLKFAQKEAAKRGMQIMYHNHSHEFQRVGDVLPMDHIKDYCRLEVDTYWVFHAGLSPADYLRENAARVGLVHLKDGSLEGVPCAVGEGKNDIEDILKASEEIGMKWVIVENDDPVPDGLSDVARSITYLKK